MLRVERDKGTFCYVNEVTGNAPENLKGELVARGSNQVIRGLELSVPPLRLWGEGLAVESVVSDPRLHESHLCNDISVKNPFRRKGFLERLGW